MAKDMILREELRARILREEPDNEDRERGYALVNVLNHESFLDEHIPGSINIPKGNEVEFERRFDRQKEIIVYCASPQCSASAIVAEELAGRGFSNVVKYEGGMADWEAGGNELERGHDAIHEIRIA